MIPGSDAVTIGFCRAYREQGDWVLSFDTAPQWLVDELCWAPPERTSTRRTTDEDGTDHLELKLRVPVPK